MWGFTYHLELKNEAKFAPMYVGIYLSAIFYFSIQIDPLHVCGYLPRLLHYETCTHILN